MLKIALIFHSASNDNLGVGALSVSEVAILRRIAGARGLSLAITVIDSIADPHLRFLRLTDDVAPVELRMAWLRDSDDRALHAVLRLSESVLPTPQD